MKVVIGLGNPGEKYDSTRHNVGFMFLNFYAKELGLEWQEHKKFKAKYIKTNEVLLLKPMSYMNNSGIPVRQVLDYYKLLPKTLGIIQKRNSDIHEFLTVVHDELDIDFGKYKISVDSGSAGHNGIKSLISHLKTKNFRRVRLGIKTEYKKNYPTEKFVLQKFNRDELVQLEINFSKIVREI